MTSAVAEIPAYMRERVQWVRWRNAERNGDVSRQVVSQAHVRQLALRDL